MRKVAISQSNYIPWKGYFDLINLVDDFVILDSVQYTRRDWRNRNKIKTSNSIIWLTVPVKVKGKYLQKICDVKINGNDWVFDHWKSIELSYKKSKYFDEISMWLKPLYFENEYIFLSDLNKKFIIAILSYLGIQTNIMSSSEFKEVSKKDERILHILKELNATDYISGPAAKSYIDEEIFHSQNINIKWMNYNNYPSYQQLWGDFVHEVSIIDLLFNCGKSSLLHLKGY